MPKFAAALVVSSLLRLRPAAADGSATERATCRADGDCAAPAQRDHLLLQVATPNATVALAQGRRGFWNPSSHISGSGQWCVAHAPADWANHCDLGAHEVKVLTYNLYWWNLYGSHFRNGNGGSAGHLIASSGGDKPYDFMGFQECEDVGRVLREAGLETTHEGIVGDHACAIAYNKATWTMLENGMDEVGEDRADQWWGTRGAQWARFKHTSKGRTVFVVNHHGPLPVGTGGLCGPQATAWNILKAIGTHAKKDDAVIVVGDFNADAGTATAAELGRRLHRVFTGASFGGVDHVFSSCGGDRVVSKRNLGAGGSDHDALEVVLRV
uniref:Endonuclease/exonuclease/phosphatase domain-containing protein n=1 Tax=Zooxanthella nutricula TaxID=1333877 RepID=A0A7S2JUH2_9DINO